MNVVTSNTLGYASGYAANPCGYVSYAVTRCFPTAHTCGCARGETIIPSREKHKPWRNRVTHVTTAISGVTDRVTNAFSRNHKEKGVVMEKSREEMQVWVKQNLPTCAAVAAEFKAEFGDVRMVYACENGHSIGKASPEGISLADTSISGSMGKRSAR